MHTLYFVSLASKAKIKTVSVSHCTKHTITKDNEVLPRYTRFFQYCDTFKQAKKTLLLALNAEEMELRKRLQEIEEQINTIENTTDPLLAQSDDE